MGRKKRPGVAKNSFSSHAVSFASCSQTHHFLAAATARPRALTASNHNSRMKRGLDAVTSGLSYERSPQ